jgi:hypothetical protein
VASWNPAEPKTDVQSVSQGRETCADNSSASGGADKSLVSGVASCLFVLVVVPRIYWF